MTASTEQGSEEMVQEQVTTTNESSSLETQTRSAVDSSPPLPVITTQESDVRKTTRISKPPVWLQDYVINGKGT